MKLRHLSPLAVAAGTAAALLLAPSTSHAAGTAHGDSIGTTRDATIGVSTPDAVRSLPHATPDDAGTPPLGLPSFHKLALTGTFGDLAVVGADIWISVDNEVDVYSTAGKHLATFSGVLGAAGIIASADQSQVYVASAQDSKIITYDAATRTQSASWTTSGCPTDLAIAGGRLFYSYGCTSPQGAIGSVSLSDGTEGPVIAESLDQPARLAGAGQTLVSMSQGATPRDLTSYLIANDGTATTQGTAHVSSGYDLAVAPDGSKLVVAGGDLERFNTTDLSAAGTFKLSNSGQSVAYSPDGSSFAGAVASGQGEMVRVLGDTSGSVTSHSGDDSDTDNPAVVPGTLHYSSSGGRVYAIVTLDGTNGLLTATTGPVTESKLTATVTNPSAYGKSLVLRISAANRPKTKVAVLVPITGPAGYHEVDATTDVGGKAVVKVSAPPLSGKAAVAVAGDLTHSTRSVTKTIKVPAKLKVTPTRYYSSRGGIRHYHSVAAVHLVTQALPKRSMTMKITLQARIGGHWVSRVSDTFPSASDGSGYVYLKSANKDLPYRLVLSFTGDLLNSKAPSVASTTFVVD